jgi:hypothetical protein
MSDLCRGGTQLNQSAVRKMIGKQVYAVHKRGGKITGKLVKVSGNTLYLQPLSKSSKKVRTNAIIPLALFDLLAIGTSPYAYGAAPFYGGYPGAYGAAPFYGGYPGVFW